MAIIQMIFFSLIMTIMTGENTHTHTHTFPQACIVLCANCSHFRKPNLMCMAFYCIYLASLGATTNNEHFWSLQNYIMPRKNWIYFTNRNVFSQWRWFNARLWSKFTWLRLLKNVLYASHTIRTVPWWMMQKLCELCACLFFFLSKLT